MRKAHTVGLLVFGSEAVPPFATPRPWPGGWQQILLAAGSGGLPEARARARVLSASGQPWGGLTELLYVKVTWGFLVAGLQFRP